MHLSAAEAEGGSVVLSQLGQVLCEASRNLRVVRPEFRELAEVKAAGKVLTLLCLPLSFLHVPDGVCPSNQLAKHLFFLRGRPLRCHGRDARVPKLDGTVCA